MKEERKEGSKQARKINYISNSLYRKKGNWYLLIIYAVQIGRYVRPFQSTLLLPYSGYNSGTIYQIYMLT
jgi:hypothetical protein